MPDLGIMLITNQFGDLFIVLNKAKRSELCSWIQNYICWLYTVRMSVLCQGELMELKSWIPLLGAISVEDYTFRRFISCLALWKTQRLRKEKSSVSLSTATVWILNPPDFLQRYELYHHEKYSLLQLETTLPLPQRDGFHPWMCHWNFVFFVYLWIPLLIC